MLNNLRHKLSSDEGAVGTVETIVLIFLAAVISVSIYKHLIRPILDSSNSVGHSIGEF